MPKLVDNEERRLAIADAAARVIAGQGMVGATMREVASAAGVTTGALTHYFRDKRQMLLFTLQASLERRRAAYPRLDSGDALVDLHHLLESVLPIDEITHLHWTVTIAFASQAGADPELAEVQRDAYRSFLAEITELVERVMADDAGHAPTDSVRAAERLIALVDGVAIQALFDPDRWSPRRQRDHVRHAIDELCQVRT